MRVDGEVGRWPFREPQLSIGVEGEYEEERGESVQVDENFVPDLPCPGEGDGEKLDPPCHGSCDMEMRGPGSASWNHKGSKGCERPGEQVDVPFHLDHLGHGDVWRCILVLRGERKLGAQGEELVLQPLEDRDDSGAGSPKDGRGQTKVGVEFVNTTQQCDLRGILPYPSPVGEARLTPVSTSRVELWHLVTRNKVRGRIESCARGFDGSRSPMRSGSIMPLTPRIVSGRS